MKKILSALCASAIGLTAISIPLATASAAPFVPMEVQNGSDVTQVDWHGRRDYRRGGFYARGGAHFYNGHRGYRHYRPGYRSYNGWWFPLAAFGAGALIGGALAEPAPVPVYREPVPVYRDRVYMSDAHVSWCYDRYRSYRASDNTFQPYNGPRQQCYSPYD